MGFLRILKKFGINSQSLNFHAMRHLPDQVREMGALWRFSSFPFESAHRELLTSFSGTTKSSRSLAEEFLKRQDQRSSHFEQQRKIGLPLGPAVKKLTKITAECQFFFKTRRQFFW